MRQARARELTTGMRCLATPAYFALIVLIAALAALSPAFAQTPLPPAIDPGRIQQRFETVPEPDDEAQLPEIRGTAPDVPASDAISATFRLKEIRLDSASVLPREPWLELSGRYIGRQISASDVFDLARGLTSIYRDEGYMLSQVIVPPQSLEDGVLKLQVIEGYIAEVHISGDPVARDMLIKIGDRIKASRPLRARDFERYLLIANDLPGVRLRSVLAPSQTPGAADLTLIADLHKTEGYAWPALDNYGSRYLGPTQLSVWTKVNQPFNANDELRLSAAAAGDSEMSYWQLDYGQVLNVEGLRLDASFAQARTRPGGSLELFEVRGRADSVRFSLSYPLLRARNHSLVGRAAYDHRDLETDVLGAPVVEDHIRALRLGVSWTTLDALGGNNLLDIELSQGIGGTDKDDLLKSREGADGEFTRLHLNYERFQSLNSHFGLTIGIAGQWTDDPLLSSEQYSLGGRGFGRAYDPAELVGDRALAFRLEPVYMPGGDRSGLHSKQLYAFYDEGRVWTLSAAGAATTSDSLASAGVGVRLVINRNISVSIEAATQVGSYQPATEDDDVRFLGSIRMNL